MIYDRPCRVRGESGPKRGRATEVIHYKHFVWNINLYFITIPCRVRVTDKFFVTDAWSLLPRVAHGTVQHKSSIISNVGVLNDSDDSEMRMKRTVVMTQFLSVMSANPDYEIVKFIVIKCLLDFGDHEDKSKRSLKLSLRK